MFRKRVFLILLASCGLAVSLSAKKAEASVAVPQSQIDACRAWVDRQFAVGGPLPFSFVYDGKSSGEFLSGCKLKVKTGSADAAREREARTYTDPGISGGLAWLVYFILYRQSGNVVLGSLVATFVLTILSRILAVARCNPATIYLVSGIFPLVPGAGIYYTAYYLISGMPAKCSAKGLETFEIALAIVFGIIFGFSIPETLFHKRKQ